MKPRFIIFALLMFPLTVLGMVLCALYLAVRVGWDFFDYHFKP